jgi:hypothetical protein
MNLILKKKFAIDHISSIKFLGQKTLEEELKRERELFLQTKKDRIANATQAVMNVLIAETGTQDKVGLQLREKIHSTLKMAIDGQNADAMKEVGQTKEIMQQNHLASEKDAKQQKSNWKKSILLIQHRLQTIKQPSAIMLFIQ